MDRTLPRIEDAVNAELEAKLLQRPDDAQLWTAYADWLAGKGDARADLVRTQKLRDALLRFCPPHIGRDVISANWERWLGDVRPEQVDAIWFRGFVEALRIRSPVQRGFDCPQLLGRHSLRFLTVLEVSAGCEIDLDGLDQLRILKRLKLDSPNARTIRTLIAQRPPALRHFFITLDDGLRAEVVAALEHIAWLEQVERLELGPLSRADAELVLRQPERFKALGKRLILVPTEDALMAHRPKLRAVFPAATLRPHYIRKPRGPDYSFDARAIAKPQSAPSNFRDLAPVEAPKRDLSELSIDKTSSACAGSGVPFSAHPLAKDWFSRCMTCAGTDTLCISAKSVSSYSHCETTTWDSWEYVCRECGAFSSAGQDRVS